MRLNFLNLATCILLAYVLTMVLITLNAPPITGLFAGFLAPIVMRALGLPIVEIENDESK